MPDYRKMVEDLFLAPAKGYLAQAPQAPKSMGLLGQIHNAIDPVNMLGGYGGLLAMGLPPGKPGGKIPNVTKAGHAKIGGETAESNGYFYKGGQFLPSTDLPPGSFRVGKKIVKARKMNIEPGKYEPQPDPDSTAIFPIASAYAAPGTAMKGPMRFWSERGLKDSIGRPVTPESKAVGDITYGDLIEMYNQGMRWVKKPPTP